MAWAAVGGGSSNDVTAGTSYSLWGVLTAFTGEVLLLAVASDNVTTTDTNSNDHTGMSTTAGATVTWTKLYEYTNGQGGANSGVTVSLWAGVVVDDDAGTITNTTVTFSASLTKKAYAYERFTTSASAVVTEVGTRQVTAVDGNANPGSLTLGSLSSREHLWFRGIGQETNSDTDMTATGSWTRFAGGAAASTTGGGAAANIRCDIEWLISTATTATSAPTLGASCDNVSILVALDEDGSARVPRFTPYPQLLAH